jgi:hypothetical protein
MIAAEVVGLAANAGVLLTARNDRIIARGPVGAVTNALAAEIRSAKADLLAVLTTYPCARCGLFAFRQPVICYWCRKRAATR